MLVIFVYLNKFIMTIYLKILIMHYKYYHFQYIWSKLNYLTSPKRE